MKNTTSALRPLAVLALGAIAACSGSSPGYSVPPANAAPKPIVTPAGGVPLVGIGDSLTAGYQSDGFLGATTATSPLSAYPKNAVPPGQENGWWALFYAALTSPSNPAQAQAALYNPATSPLPLIAAPGMGTQLVLNATSLLANVQGSCSQINEDGYSNMQWTATRMDASDQNFDLGVPGITMHEAVEMTGPITGPPNTPSCGYQSLPNDPTAGALQSLVSGESAVFYPVMGSYMHSVSSLTELNVAVALKPKIATVWLGANDLLKFAFAGGNPVASDSTAQMTADLTKIVKSLTATGAKVLVADLPTLLPATGDTVPQFFAQSKLSDDLQALGIPSAAASAIVSYVGTQYGVTAGGYLTESGFLDIVETCEASASACVTPQLDPDGAGSGLGGIYLTPAFAAKVQALNAAYNQAIDAVATSSGSSVALVPIDALFAQTATSGVTVSGFPTFTLQFGGGLVTWDGLHPSNLGYAVIANDFISTANTAFGMSLPAVNLQTVAESDPYNPYVLKLADPALPFPLP